MKFTYIGPNKFDEMGKEWPANSYNGDTVLNGEVVELEGHFARKADKNPNYKRVRTNKKPEPVEVVEPEVVKAEVVKAEIIAPKTISEALGNREKL